MATSTRGGHVGRYTTKDERGAMVFSELLESDPLTGEKLDYAQLGFDLEDKIRGRFTSKTKYVYTANEDIKAGEQYKLKDGDHFKKGEVLFKKGEVVYTGFAPRNFVQAKFGKLVLAKKLDDGSSVDVTVPVGNFGITQATNEQYDPNVDVHILGFAKVVGDITDALVLVGGFFLGTLLMTGILLWLYLGSFKLALLPLICSITAVIWEFGMLFLLGFGLDPFAILVPFLILAVSVSHGVQYCNAWVAEITQNGRNSRDASLWTWRRLAIYGTMAIMTDVVGFALIALVPIDIVREMAYNATLGMFAIIITNKVMMPIWLCWIDIGDVKAFAAKQDQRDAILDPLWMTLSNMVRPKYAVTAILIGGLLLGWSLWKGEELTVGDSQAGVPELLPDSRYNRDTKAVTENFAIGIDVLKVIAETDPDSCTQYEAMEQIDRFDWSLENNPGVQSIISLPWGAKQVNSSFNEASLKYKVIPRNKFVMVQSITPIPTSTGLLNSNCAAMALFLFTKDHRANTLDSIVDQVKAFNVTNGKEFFENHAGGAGGAGTEASCTKKLDTWRELGARQVAVKRYTDRYRSTHSGVKDETIDALERVKALRADEAKVQKDYDAVSKTLCPVNFALATAQVGVMAATNEEVHKWEKPILGIVYVGIMILVYLSFFEWQAIVCIMLPLALVSWMAYAVMAILGIGMKVATLPVVALAAGIGGRLRYLRLRYPGRRGGERVRPETRLLHDAEDDGESRGLHRHHAGPGGRYLAVLGSAVPA